MFIVLGLGNPGEEYTKTRHNIGWRIVNHTIAELELPINNSAKLKAEISTGKLGEKKVILAKPLTFMNKSGEAARAILSFYKSQPEELIVVHDDKDIPLGEIRIQTNRGAAGHNGIKSIIEQLGTQNFIRVRIGIKPLKIVKFKANDIVLKNFSKEEEKLLGSVIKKTSEALAAVISEGLEKAMNKFN